MIYSLLFLLRVRKLPKIEPKIKLEPTTKLIGNLIVSVIKKFTLLSFELFWIPINKITNKKELKTLSINTTLELIQKKLIQLHHLNSSKLVLTSGCIFLPERCKYLFEINNQRYLYHKYHLDSGYKIKALISLVDSKDEDQQFSYIERFPESKFTYFVKRILFGQIVVFIHRLFYIISFKKIHLSGPPPELPSKYQDESLYKKFNSLKRGDMITFHNLYPHSSHNGYSRHKSPMLQLVFEKIWRF